MGEITQVSGAKNDTRCKQNLHYWTSHFAAYTKCLITKLYSVSDNINYMLLSYSTMQI
jgi:hypothetical protein